MQLDYSPANLEFAERIRVFIRANLDPATRKALDHARALGRRPIITIDGEHEVNEVFMSAAAEPSAYGVLGHDPAFRLKMARLEIRLKALELTSLRMLADQERGAAPGSEANLLKIKGSELQQDISELMMDAAGRYAFAYDPEAWAKGVHPGLAMDFQLNDTQVLLSRSIERLLSSIYDLKTRLRAGDRRHDDRLWTALADLGLMGVEIEPAYGGAGGTFEDMAAAIRPLGAALAGLPFIGSAVVAAGSLRVCVAHSEHRARDMLAWVETTARREGQHWRLSGTKAVALGGDRADLYRVTARTNGLPHEPDGLSLFAVPLDTTGLKIVAYPLYDGSGAADLAFEGVQLPDDALVGEPDGAYPDIDLAWDRGSAAVCAEAIGAMDRLRDVTLDHLKTREQFGGPIGRFQALQHRMADAYMAIELARSMSLLAVAAIADSNPAVRAAHVSAAKVTVSEACREVGQTCVQLHGAIALTEDYSAGHYFKRLAMIERLFGSADHHLRRYARLS